MHANAGDRIVIRGRRVGGAERRCEVLEARGADGGSPYLVRWADGSEGLIYPGPDAMVEAGKRRRATGGRPSGRTAST